MTPIALLPSILGDDSLKQVLEAGNPKAAKVPSVFQVGTWLLFCSVETREKSGQPDSQGLPGARWSGARQADFPFCMARNNDEPPFKSERIVSPYPATKRSHGRTFVPFRPRVPALPCPAQPCPFPPPSSETSRVTGVQKPQRAAAATHLSRVAGVFS